MMGCSFVRLVFLLTPLVAGMVGQVASILFASPVNCSWLIMSMMMIMSLCVGACAYAYNISRCLSSFQESGIATPGQARLGSLGIILMTIES